MINFTFAALTLGFASAGTYVPRTRAVVASIWHEALPMLVYSQVLIWGQSCVALLMVGLIRLGNPDVSIFLGALVTMGLETGRDVMSFSSKEIAGDWAEEVSRFEILAGWLWRRLFFFMFHECVCCRSTYFEAFLALEGGRRGEEVGKLQRERDGRNSLIGTTDSQTSNTARPSAR